MGLFLIWAVPARLILLRDYKCAFEHNASYLELYPSVYRALILYESGFVNDKLFLLNKVFQRKAAVHRGPQTRAPAGPGGWDSYFLSGPSVVQGHGPYNSAENGYSRMSCCSSATMATASPSICGVIGLSRACNRQSLAANEDFVLPDFNNFFRLANILGIL